MLEQSAILLYILRCNLPRISACKRLGLGSPPSDCTRSSGPRRTLNALTGKGVSANSLNASGVTHCAPALARASRGLASRAFNHRARRPGDCAPPPGRWAGKIPPGSLPMALALALAPAPSTRRKCAGRKLLTR